MLKKTPCGRSTLANLAWLTVLAGGLIAAPSLMAQQVTFKANNTDSLNQASSWVDGMIPDNRTIAVWDNRVAAGHSVSLGGTVEWQGVRIENPGGPISIGGGTLGLRGGGIDLSEATQNLTIGAVLNLTAPNVFHAGPGRTLSLTASQLERSPTGGIQFFEDDGGTISLGGAFTNDFIWTASFGPIYATYNGLDYAFDDGGTLTSGFEMFPEDYTPNPGQDPENPDAPPHIPTGGDEWIFLVDFVDDSTFGVSSGGGNTGILNSRFNQPNTNFDEWQATTFATGRTLSINSILVTENVGEQNVRFGGPGWVRISNSGGSGMLNLFQNNTQGDLILSPGASLTQQGGGRGLVKHGPGRVIVDAVADYTGVTHIGEGTLRFTGPMASQNLVEVFPGGNLELWGASMNVSTITLHDGALLNGFGDVQGTRQAQVGEDEEGNPIMGSVPMQIVNYGDIVLDGGAARLMLDGDLINHGTVTVSDGAYFAINGAFENYGTFDYESGFATLPEEFVNEGTIIEGQEGPPGLPEGFRINVRDFTISDGQATLVTDSHPGLNYALQRTETLRFPTTEHYTVTSSADSTLGNDGQRGPDTNHGGNANLFIRNYVDVREQVAIMRFDLSEAPDELMLEEAVLRLFFTGHNRTRTFEVWGLTDESLDDWDEMEVTYNNFGGFVPDQPLGIKVVDTSAMQLLGYVLGQDITQGAQLFSTENMVSSIDPEVEAEPADLSGFLAADTNGLVTFVVFMTGTDSNATYSVASRQHPDLGTFHPLTGNLIFPPTLEIPTEESFLDWQTSDPWVQVGSGQPTFGDDMTFTAPVDLSQPQGFFRVIMED